MQDIQQKLDEIERLHAEVQRHMDRFAGLLKTTYHNPTPAAMLILRQEHRELNRQNALLEAQFNQLKEKSQMKRVSLFALIVIALLVFVTSFAVAQDAPLETNTPLIVESTATLVSSEPILTEAPAATEAPPVVIPPEPQQPAADPSERTIYVIGFVAFLVYQAVTGFFSKKERDSFLKSLEKAHDDKRLMDEARQRYQETSLPVQEAIKLIQAITGVVGSLNLPIVDAIVDQTNEIISDVVNPPEGDLAAGGHNSLRGVDFNNVSGAWIEPTADNG